MYLLYEEVLREYFISFILLFYIVFLFYIINYWNCLQCAGFLGLIRDNQDNLQNMDFDYEYKCWFSYDIVVRLEKIGVGFKYFQDMQVFLVCDQVSLL